MLITVSVNIGLIDEVLDLSWYTRETGVTWLSVENHTIVLNALTGVLLCLYKGGSSMRDWYFRDYQTKVSTSTPFSFFLLLLLSLSLIDTILRLRDWDVSVHWWRSKTFSFSLRSFHYYFQYVVQTVYSLSYLRLYLDCRPSGVKEFYKVYLCFIRTRKLGSWNPPVPFS